MFLVTMEARVAPELEEQLRRAYDHVMSHRPPGVVQSLLTRDAHDSSIWRILTFWESHDALEAHYKSGALMPSAYVFYLIELTPVTVASEIIASDVAVTLPSRQQQHDQNDAIS
jgi:quinol monooxygenase YgiN